ncbi:MAG: c-type cytochrome [Chloroflexi bacterium]|nr:c-type cytochrome [Chloroflexota bacterium]
MQVKIVIGTVAFMLTMIILGYAALREPARLQEFTHAAEGRSVENGAELYVNNCANCHGNDGTAETCFDSAGEQIACLGIPLNSATLVCGDRPGRLEIMGWDGSKEDFVYRTVAAGRGLVMPTWSADFGGPLRNDQVQNLADFVLNFEGEELCSAPLPAAYEFAESVDDFMAEFLAGDAARGEELYTLTYGCAGCHGALDDSSRAGVGPRLGEVATNASSRVPDISAEQYVYESILEPSAYVVDGYAEGLMPANFAWRMGETVETPQDMADLLAYILGE